MFDGGLDQYFFNSSRRYTAEALDGVALLAAGQHLLLLLSEAIDAVRSAARGVWHSMIPTGANASPRCRYQPWNH